MQIFVHLYSVQCAYCSKCIAYYFRLLDARDVSHWPYLVGIVNVVVAVAVLVYALNYNL